VRDRHAADAFAAAALPGHVRTVPNGLGRPDCSKRGIRPKFKHRQL
jgi:hypothetical protein